LAPAGWAFQLNIFIFIMAKKFKRGDRFLAKYEGKVRNFIYAQHRSRKTFYAVLVSENNLYIVEKLVILDKRNL